MVTGRYGQTQVWSQAGMVTGRYGHTQVWSEVDMVRGVTMTDHFKKELTAKWLFSPSSTFFFFLHF